VTFTGTDPSAISNTPGGWTVTIPTLDTISVVHGLGKQPTSAMVWGLTADGATWTSRSIGGSGLNMTYGTSTATTTTIINGVSTTSVAAQGLTAIIELIF
jgi:hypothetical protein